MWNQVLSDPHGRDRAPNNQDILLKKHERSSTLSNRCLPEIHTCFARLSGFRYCRECQTLPRWLSATSFNPSISGTHGASLSETVATTTASNSSVHHSIHKCVLLSSIFSISPPRLHIRYHRVHVFSFGTHTLENLATLYPYLHRPVCKFDVFAFSS